MSKDIHANSLITVTDEQISTDLANEAVILNTASGKYYSLDGVGTTVWENIQSPTSVQRILDILLSTYEVDAKRCQNDLYALLTDLDQAGLISISNR